MTLRLAHALLIAASLAVAPVAAFGQLYKWVDADGTVNYGDSPPKGVKNVRALGKDSGNLTVVPGIPKEERERLREREEQARLQRLEREVEELRAREEARAYSQPEVVYTEAWAPAYGGYWPHRVRPPGQGHKPKPEHPVGKPRPVDRTPPAQELPVAVPRDPPGTMLRR
jgi:hypothetical protein